MNRAIVLGLADTATANSDEIGPVVVQALRRLETGRADLAVFAGNDATRLCDRWAKADLVVLVAAGAGASWSPGRVHRRSLRHPSMTSTLPPGRHAQVVRDALALGAATNQLPPTLLLYSVDTPANGVPPVAVRVAVEAVAAEIAEEISADRHWIRNDNLLNHRG